jgi:hypothetical protein
MKKFQELKNLVLTIEGDALKFYEKGNQAAGRRLRKALLNVRSSATNIRKDVSALKTK